MEFKIGNSAGKARVLEPVAHVQQAPVAPLPHPAQPAGAAEANGRQERAAGVLPAMLETRQKGVSPVELRPSATLLERELDELARGGDARRFGDRVYERARQILEEAYESASELRLEALSRIREQMSASERAGTDLRTRATEESATVKAQAQTEAQLALQRAQREADAIVANARATAQRIAEGSHAESEAIQKRAQREAQEVHDAAARALAEARTRLEEIERLEGEFEATARGIAKWLGLTVDHDRSLFRGLARGKK